MLRSMLDSLTRRDALGLMLAGGAAWLFTARPVRAGVAVGVSLPELLRSSTAVGFAASSEASSRWEEIGGSKRIVTYHRVGFDELLVGQDRELWVRTLGGRVGDIAQIVHGEAELRVGEPCLLFVSPGRDGVSVVTEMAQGHYPLRDQGGALRLHPSPRLGTLVRPDGSAAKALIGRTRGEARSVLDEARRAAK
jgi:hypothetical protein